MGTTCSSGLNNLLASSAVTQTTLPSWYNTAQQNIVNQAGVAAAGAPQFQNTVGQNAINNLQDPNNQFSQASNALGQISSGAANPWLVCQAAGTVKPNVNTAMGGLFQAQNQQLNQLLPTTIAPQQGGNIGSGNFGSLRGETAIDTAKANAFATLAAQQMQSALQNQATGASAANALGNVGAQCINANLTTGTAQMNAPFQSIGNYANLINAINAPTTATEQAQLSPLQAISALAGAPKAACSLLSSLGQTNLLQSLKGMAGAIVPQLSSTSPDFNPTTSDWTAPTIPSDLSNWSEPTFDPSTGGWNIPE